MKYLIVTLFMLTGCGIDVHGKVDTSGTNTVKIDLSGIDDFFLQECEILAGASGTQADIDSCVSKMTLDFARFLNK